MNQFVAQVDRMLTEHRPFGEIEDRIEGMAVADDEKAALWLLAWSEQEESVRRRTVSETLAVVAATG